MRRTLRQLAAVKPSRYLEAGTPTGLTGLYTHNAPRSALIYLYSSTLEKLRSFPESSLYRQSTEAVTSHRLSIISSVKPAGYDEWAAKAKKILAEHPEVFTTTKGGVPFEGGKHIKDVKDGRIFVTTQLEKEVDYSREEWDGEENFGPELEGTRTTAERKGQAVFGTPRPGSDAKTVKWAPEPALTIEQVEEIENKIGAGLIEEVIQVAEGELKLVDIMLESKVWEDLEEKPADGQWTYFARDTATGETQGPPPK
ncbi:hypothetical protein B7494_g6117 [Chlorociboria aeruginascens]|nr:hypothetical protein B7494_g6117 [Chlorociboria aeruginascens]